MGRERESEMFITKINARIDASYEKVKSIRNEHEKKKEEEKKNSCFLFSQPKKEEQK